MGRARKLAAGYQPAVIKVVSYARGVARATATGQYIQREDCRHQGRWSAGRTFAGPRQRVSIGARTVTIAAAAPLKALSGPLHEALTPLIVTLVLLAAALIGGVLLQVRLGLRPLTLLQAELTRVRTGRAERITGSQPSEIAPLVSELNALLDQNTAKLERARRHVANLAHGLKTPLATLALALEESVCDPTGALLPLVTTLDRRIRHHLTRARTAALGAAERSRVLLAPRIADHLAVFANYMPKKGSAPRSERTWQSPANRKTSTNCSAICSTTPANGRGTGS